MVMGTIGQSGQYWHVLKSHSSTFQLVTTLPHRAFQSLKIRQLPKREPWMQKSLSSPGREKGLGGASRTLQAYWKICPDILNPPPPPPPTHTHKHTTRPSIDHLHTILHRYPFPSHISGREGGGATRRKGGMRGVRVFLF